MANNSNNDAAKANILGFFSTTRVNAVDRASIDESIFAASVLQYTDRLSDAHGFEMAEFDAAVVNRIGDAGRFMLVHMQIRITESEVPDVSEEEDKISSGYGGSVE